MKRFFISAIVALGCLVAHADGLIPSFKIDPGNSQWVDVIIPNATSMTALQFDVTVPEGITLSKVSRNNNTEDREIRYEKVGTNKYRILTYSMKNATFEDANNVLFMVFDAASDAAAGAKEAEVGGIVIVDPEGNATEPADEKVTVAIQGNETITIGSSGKTTFVCSSGLDFEGNEAKAYIVTGVDAGNVWMTGIKKVPANTPIVVVGSEGDHTVPTAEIKGVYYQNFLIGNNTDADINVTPEGTDQFLRLGTKGFSRFTDTKSVGAHKAYIRAKALPAAKAGSSVPVSIGDGLRTSLCADVDLDFSSADVKAYIATGYDGTIWLSRVMTASAGTPLYIRGAQGEYTIPSAAAQTVFANMLVGNNSDAKITINATDGEYTNFFVGKSGFSKVNGTRDVSAHKSYLQILTSYLPTASRGIDSMDINETEVEMFSLPLGVLGEDGDATGICAIEESQNETWYNLKGQRIDAPTKKGLYIKNGKKVIVK